MLRKLAGYQSLPTHVVLTLSTVLLCTTLHGQATKEDSTASDDGGKSTQQTAASSDEKAKPQPASVVSLRLRGSLAEAPSAPGLFGQLQTGLPRILKNLDKIAADEKIPAVILKIRSPAIGAGKLGELRQAIKKTRKAGKVVYADLESATVADYLLASACDQIVMPESGMLLLPGVRAEVMFYKGLFDKLGVQVDMLQIGRFKGAGEPYSRQQMSDAFRQQYELVIDDLYDELVDTIATDRAMQREKVKTIIDTGLFTAAAAKKAGLIDIVAYEDEMASVLQNRLKVEQVAISTDYGKRKVDTDFSGMLGMIKLMELFTGGSSARGRSSQKKIAIVHAHGAILSGTSQSSLLGGTTMGSDTIIKAIRQASKDEKVKAIVLRVDSPGGSALASDLIWRAIQQVDKPVVASMGNMAASGGYYISMGCDYVVAQPRTLTGSIGVVGGKLAIGPALGKFGLHTEVISRGKNSGIFTSTEPFSAAERQVLLSMMKETYDQFVSKAATGRGMARDRLEELAEGRIWTGRQAKANGLIDELGTLEDAIAKARSMAGIAEDEDIERLNLPKAKNVFEQLLEGSMVKTPIGATVQRLARPAAEVETLSALFSERVLLWLPYRVEVH